MKTLLLTVIIALLGFAAAPTASASDYSYRYHTVGYCKPYVVHTCVLSSRIECRWGRDHCGRSYTYHVKVITYRATYNTGATTIYSRTVRV